jgi:hypothetical protein
LLGLWPSNPTLACVVAPARRNADSAGGGSRRGATIGRVVRTFHGTDYSWLAVDMRGHVGWFVLNMSGPVPEALEEEGLIEHEDRLGEWVRSTGRAFAFGTGDSMWRDAAATGVFAFDFDDARARYRLVAAPRSPVLREATPDAVRALLTVRLPTADFATRVVTEAQVAAAAPV